MTIIDRARMESAWGENVWEEQDQCITSIDFIKQDEIQATLRGVHWDLVVVDEAHKMSASVWGQRDYSTIVRVAQRFPQSVLQEDVSLLMYYDNALMRAVCASAGVVLAAVLVPERVSTGVLGGFG